MFRLTLLLVEFLGFCLFWCWVFFRVFSLFCLGFFLATRPKPQPLPSSDSFHAPSHSSTNTGTWRCQKTKSWVHHRLKLDAQFLYCKELDLPYQLASIVSPQVPNFPPLSPLFCVSNFCSSSKKPSKLCKVVRESKTKKKTKQKQNKKPKPNTKTIHPEDYTPHRSNQSVVHGQ